MTKRTDAAWKACQEAMAMEREKAQGGKQK